MANMRAPLRRRLSRCVPPGVLLLAASCALGRAPSAGPRPDPGLLLHPENAAFAEPAPDSFRVAFRTSAGAFTVEAVRAWAPRGVDRFYGLVRAGFYDGDRFFRVLDGFVVQFGLNGDPAVSRAWKDRTIRDDPVVESNLSGTVSFATSGPDTRTTQLFVNLGDNRRLDARGFAPIGRVVDGMEVVRSLFGGYGEGPPRGSGPDQDRIEGEGNAYLARQFPELDFIIEARIVPKPESGG